MQAAPSLLKDWHEFYLLAGTAASALIALLFVAASVGVGFLTAERAAATRVYMTPIIFHFTSILFIGLIVLAPVDVPFARTLLMGANGVIGAVASAVVFKRVLTSREADWIDRLAYGVAPILSYGAIILAAAGLFLGSAAACDLLAGGIVLLLLANIRNAWDMTLVMVRFQSRR